MDRVPFPFDDPKADTVFKTSDGVEVRSYKVLLSLASPVFQSMLELPQNQDPGNQAPVEVQEESTRLMNALRWCDPRATPSLKVQDLLDALIIGDKYEMVHVISKVRMALYKVLKSTNAEDTLRLFAIAYRLRQEELLQVAAHRTLSHSSDNRPHVEELEHIPATAVNQLTRYHSNFRGKVRALLTNHNLFRFDNGPLDTLCRSISCKGWTYLNSDSPLPDWLKAYLTGLGNYFRTVDSAPSTLSAKGIPCATRAEADMAACTGCKNKIRLFVETETRYLQWLDMEAKKASPRLSAFAPLNPSY